MKRVIAKLPAMFEGKAVAPECAKAAEKRALQGKAVVPGRQSCREAFEAGKRQF